MAPREESGEQDIGMSSIYESASAVDWGRNLLAPSTQRAPYVPVGK